MFTTTAQLCMLILAGLNEMGGEGIPGEMVYFPGRS